MYRTPKIILSTLVALLLLTVVLIGRAVSRFVPESRVQFNSIEITEANRVGCVSQSRAINFEIEFDCAFRIHLPNTELPGNHSTPMAMSEHLALFIEQFSGGQKLPMGLGANSIAIGDEEQYEFLVDTKSTYNVIPSSPLAVANIIDQNGLTRTVYVVATSNKRGR